MKMIMMIVQQIDNNSFFLSCWLTSHIYVAWSRIVQTCGALNNTLLCRS